MFRYVPPPCAGVRLCAPLCANMHRYAPLCTAMHRYARAYSGSGMTSPIGMASPGELVLYLTPLDAIRVYALSFRVNRKAFSIETPPVHLDHAAGPLIDVVAGVAQGRDLDRVRHQRRLS